MRTAWLLTWMCLLLARGGAQEALTPQREVLFKAPGIAVAAHFSPCGRWVLFVGKGPPDVPVSLYSTKGKKYFTLNTLSGRYRTSDAVRVAWTPDGYTAFVNLSGSDPAVWRVDTRKRTYTAVPPAGDRRFERIFPSPNGKILAVTDRRNPGVTLLNVVSRKEHGVNLDERVVQLCWSPDGKAVYAMEHEGGLARKGGFLLHRINAAGGLPHTSFRCPESLQGTADGIRFNVKLCRVAVQPGLKAGQYPLVLFAGGSGKGVHRIEDEGVLPGAWSPCGKFFGYFCPDGSSTRRFSLHVTRAFTKKVRKVLDRVVPAPDRPRMRWFPSGRWILTVRDRRVVVVNPSGKTVFPTLHRMPRRGVDRSLLSDLEILASGKLIAWDRDSGEIVQFGFRRED